MKLSQIITHLADTGLEDYCGTIFDGTDEIIINYEERVKAEDAR